MNWVKERLQEKSTQTALVGLLTVLLPYLHVPVEVQAPLATFLVTFFFAVSVTKG